MLQILCKTPAVIFNFKIQIPADNKAKFKIQYLGQMPRRTGLFRGLISEGTSVIMVVGAQVFVDAYLLQPPTFQA